MTAVFTKVSAQGIARTPIALADLADAILKQAKTNASNGSHAWGTPTPARPGEGPARISGTLVRSLARTSVNRTVTGAEVRVGTQPGMAPPYSRTPSSKYGSYLEQGLKNGARYPFLTTAFVFGVHVAAPAIYRKAYGDGWKRLA
ncbi:hypothetical protein F7Q99_20210 [Streptomyces kaniharaensis]|uniref:HK97 gp10 family phage protein n=1 Tax=Streptomyces kaniharaensis TaxID=212423 RepID=A0A6N7KUM0_9ACTN|nr:hypothetical protein [Streptomyces kaniharaensis]MQS14525.1 hypothetical protein [Streptomyces kaniharaensis]